MIRSRQLSIKRNIPESPLFWPVTIEKASMSVLDETQIPHKTHYIKVNTPKAAVNVIKNMKTRAFGQFLVVLNTFLMRLAKSGPQIKDEALLADLNKIAQALNDSRPTFPFGEVTSIILNWAQEAVADKRDLKKTLEKQIKGYLKNIRERRLERVQKIAHLIKDGDSILTHCNVSGELAMAAALAISEGKSVHFFVTETRPYLQGAKLTSWELQNMGANVTLIADNAVGAIMEEGLVDKVIVGSDRSCANGDFANKIGTYQIAVLAHTFKVPFYVLTQPSDRIPSGTHIHVEMRHGDEILYYQDKKLVQGNVKAFYPAFDVIPHNLITETIPIHAR